MSSKALATHHIAIVLRSVQKLLDQVLKRRPEIGDRDEQVDHGCEKLDGDFHQLSVFALKDKPSR